MSHFPVLVLVDDDVARETAEAAVAPLLAPYNENDEWFAEGSRWDWWMIGGRWTGSISPEPYEPGEDPENFETCWLCQGTGLRPDWELFEAESPGWREWSGGCNGCRGKGWETVWPTRWKPYDGDVQPVASLAADFVPMAIVTPDGRWHEQARMGWFGMTTEDEGGNGEKPEALWRATYKALLEQHPEATAVLVDCHV